LPRKIIEEFYYKNKTMFIFRVKLKKFKGWSFWAEKITTRDIMYMGEVDSLKFIPATKTWKEIIKEYETK
jgi:MinD-like ATPase involved in chromosome partitioning or flagellar assembly